MTIDPVPLLSLPVAEKMRLVELLWDSLGDDLQEVPVPDWAVAEANRRRSELLHDPGIALTYKEMWQRVSIQNNG
ncbi:MAG: hypothetical protein RIT02_2860 [Planctomycetota bacterium]|jgi:putative addiction module component (TIGR02574 family)